MSAHKVETVVDLERRGNIMFFKGEKRDKIVSFQIPIKAPEHTVWSGKREDGEEVVEKA